MRRSLIRRGCASWTPCRAGDASPSELATVLGMPSNLLAHHLNVLAGRGTDRAPALGGRSPTQLPAAGARRAGRARPPATLNGTRRVLFVCTANSARSHLAAALWRRASAVPVASAGTHPAARIDSGALAAAARHRLPLRRARPRRLDDVQGDGDLIITVCDLAHEELSDRSALHWSVPDPVPSRHPGRVRRSLRRAHPPGQRPGPAPDRRAVAAS